MVLVLRRTLEETHRVLVATPLVPQVLRVPQSLVLLVFLLQFAMVLTWVSHFPLFFPFRGTE